MAPTVGDRGSDQRSNSRRDRTHRTTLLWRGANAQPDGVPPGARPAVRRPRGVLLGGGVRLFGYPMVRRRAAATHPAVTPLAIARRDGGAAVACPHVAAASGTGRLVR
ncbi:hypothetical protein GCM10009635_01960 [Actinocatenispora thailandica]